MCEELIPHFLTIKSMAFLPIGPDDASWAAGGRGASTVHACLRGPPTCHIPPKTSCRGEAQDPTDVTYLQLEPLTSFSVQHVCDCLTCFHTFGVR